MDRLLAMGVMCAVLAMPLAASADDPPPGFDRIRIELVPATVGGNVDEKDQVSFAVTVIDGTNFREFPQTYREWKFTGTNGAPLRVTAPVCGWPFFQVAVQNKSDQILKLRSGGAGDEVVIVVEDEQGGTIEAKRKKALVKAAQEAPPSSVATTDPAASDSAMRADYMDMLTRLPMLTDEASILPGRKATFIACFDYVPGAKRTSEVDAWFEGRKEITLGFFDVPVSRDAGGAVKKKTSYQVRLLVKVWKDRYEYQLNKETDSWTPVVKGSSILRDAVPAPTPSPAK